MQQPRVIGKNNKRAHIFFKMQPEHSVKELVLKQAKYCEIFNMSIATKVTNPVHTKRIGHIAGVNIKMPSEKWHLKNVERELGIKEGIIEIKKEFVLTQGCKSK